MKTFYIHTLGCKINQYESQALRESWELRGYAEVTDATTADVILINSCAVTARAVSDVRQSARRLHRENPEARLVITGCAAEVLRKELADIPGVSEVIPQSEKTRLLESPEARRADGDGGIADRWEMSISKFVRARAVVKVQDGCSHRCTYCIVPSTRGAAVSRRPDEIISEIRRLFEGGVREIMLSGVNLRQFGRDLPDGEDFWALLKRIDSELAPEWAGRARFRISSLEPGQLADRGLETIAACRMLCPHLHISLQSGSYSVLKRMGRGHYRPEQLAEFLAGLGNIWPIFGLGADIIAGFPGETEEEFEESLAFVKALPLTYAHVFPYSRRPDTPAATMPGQLPKDVKKVRAARLRETAEAKKRAFLERLAALERVTVAVQDTGAESGAARGVCEYYVDCRFDGTLPEESQRELVPAKPTSAESEYLTVIAEYPR